MIAIRFVVAYTFRSVEKMNHKWSYHSSHDQCLNLLYCGLSRVSRVLYCCTGARCRNPEAVKNGAVPLVGSPWCGYGMENKPKWVGTSGLHRTE